MMGHESREFRPAGILSLLAGFQTLVKRDTCFYGYRSFKWIYRGCEQQDKGAETCVLWSTELQKIQEQDLVLYAMTRSVIRMCKSIFSHNEKHITKTGRYWTPAGKISTYFISCSTPTFDIEPKRGPYIPVLFLIK